MGKILRIGYRHIEAIRFETVLNLGFAFAGHVSFNLREWIAAEAPQLLPSFDRIRFGKGIALAHVNDPSRNYALALNSVLQAYEIGMAGTDMHRYFRHSMISTSMSDHQDEDTFGSEMGGAWEPVPFIVKGGILLTLGALEEYERGTIRVLVGGRWHGATIDEPFRPNLSDFTLRSPEWQSLERRRRTYTNKGREEILASYGICRAETDWRERLNRAWKDRNKIAHAFEQVNVSFGQFLQVHIDVFCAMSHLADECWKECSIEL